MDSLFLILTILFIVASVAMILIILVQRPQGGGLAGAFGGAGGGGTEGVFGGRVGDALTVMTVCGFAVYLVLAIVLNSDIWTPGSDDTVASNQGSDSPPSEESRINRLLFPEADAEFRFNDDDAAWASQPSDTSAGQEATDDSESNAPAPAPSPPTEPTPSPPPEGEGN